MKRIGRNLPGVVIVALVGLQFASISRAAERDPYEPAKDHYEPDLLIVGGSSSGTAAALTAGRLKLPTVWVLRAPRDMGGLSTNAINPDSDLPIRYIGGLAMEYDLVARYTSGFNVGGGHNGEGYFTPFHVLFDYTRAQIDALPSVTVVADLYPLAAEKDPRSHRLAAVTFGHRLQPNRRIVIRPKVTIDAEIEGDVSFLAGASMTLVREAQQPSDDPTRNLESYAGRIFTPMKRLGALTAAGGKLLPRSTHQADTAPATMGWNGSVTLQDFGKGDANSPWVLKTEPPGYDPAEFAWWTDGIFGVDFGGGIRRWNMDPFLSTIEGWRLPDGRHVLESMDIRDREANEKSHLAHVIRALWHLQHTKKQFRYGLSEKDFHEGLPPKYTLADLGATTNAGDAPLPGLIYMREGRRLVNDHVFGGKLIEDDGSGMGIQKRGWNARSAYFNAMLVDIHGVHAEQVPGSGPEGMQLLRLAGYHNFGAPCVPFDVFLPRPTEVTGLLVSSAGAYTHEAYAAFPRMETGRIAQGHACAVAAYVALRDGVAVDAVDVRKLQIANLSLNGQSIVYLQDTIPGTAWQLVDQMLGARRVPERNDAGVFQREDRVTAEEMSAVLTRLFRDYAESPAPPSRLAAALALLPDKSDAAVTRIQALRALNGAAGLVSEAPNAAIFADVSARSSAASALAPWLAKGWIRASGAERFDADAPISFSEFKRHAYHALYGDLAPQTVRPVDYRPWLAHDTFNRPNGPLHELGDGPHPIATTATGKWEINGGQLRALPPYNRTTYLLADVGRADVDVSVDVFLEQTRRSAVAGIGVGAVDDANMHRFLVETDGLALKFRSDTLQAGESIDPAMGSRVTPKRGLTLRVVIKADQMSMYVDDVLIRTEKRPLRPGGTRIGLVNGGGDGSRFDNLEVRPTEQ